MRFGYYLNPQTPGPESDGRVIDEVLAQLDLADQLGYRDVWITDHQFTGYNAYSDPMVMAGAITQRCPNLHIGLSVAVVPLMNPIRFITQCNLIDQLSGGRFAVGIGAGNSPDEFRGYGLDASERHAMMGEFLDVIEKAWSAPPEGFSYEGKFWSGSVRGRIIPSPRQSPRPHIVYATATPATLERIGRKGWSLLLGPQAPTVTAGRLKHYLTGLNGAGLDEAARQRAWRDTGILRQVYVAAPGEDWRESIDEYIGIYARKSALANTGIDYLPKEDLERRKEGYLQNWLVAGPAEDVIERLKPFARLGLGHMMCWFEFGHMPDEMVRKSMTRFAASVMPALQDTKPDPDLLARLLAESDNQAEAPELLRIP